MPDDTGLQMLTRVAEPELMDGVPQADAYASADLSELHGPLVAEFVGRFATAEGRLLDVGCGAGDMTVRILEACPHLTAVGVDGSAPMLARAQESVTRAQLGARVRLERLVVPHRSLETGFDVVIANSVLHHVADPVAFWRWLARCVRPGGSVVVADLRRPTDLAEVRRRVHAFSDGAHADVQRDFFNSLRAAYTRAEIRQQLDTAGLSGFTVTNLGDLHVIAGGVVAEHGASWIL